MDDIEKSELHTLESRALKPFAYVSSCEGSVEHSFIPPRSGEGLCFLLRGRIPSPHGADRSAPIKRVSVEHPLSPIRFGVGSKQNMQKALDPLFPRLSGILYEYEMATFPPCLCVSA